MCHIEDQHYIDKFKMKTSKNHDATVEAISNKAMVKCASRDLIMTLWKKILTLRCDCNF